MRLNAKPVVLAIALAISAVFLAEALAYAQCPPGYRWSNRMRSCVPAGPPRGYYPPPPPPPRHNRRRCNWYYQDCAQSCRGYRHCLRQCRHRYDRCMGGYGW